MILRSQFFPCLPPQTHATKFLLELSVWCKVFVVIKIYFKLITFLELKTVLHIIIPSSSTEHIIYTTRGLEIKSEWIIYPHKGADVVVKLG